MQRDYALIRILHQRKIDGGHVRGERERKDRVRFLKISMCVRVCVRVWVGACVCVREGE